MNWKITPCAQLCSLFTVSFLVVFLRLTTAIAQPIQVESGRYQIDNSLKLIVCNQVPVFPAGQTLPTLHFDKDYIFTQSVSAFEIGKPYKVKTGSITYTLYFTGFPLIEIKTDGSQVISNTDDRTKGTFTLATGAEPLFTASMGIRNRGNISRKFPKKSYNMELWKDPDGNEELETSLLNMRSDSKWYLLAMYNEPLRITNATSHALWLNMHKLYYAAQESDANSGIRTKYCDVFINNSYAGVYLFTEPMDRKQLKLKKTGSNGEIRGELYKADGWSVATSFTSLPPPPSNPAAEEWEEFEMDYPDPYWSNLYELLRFTITSSAADFEANVSKRFKIDNLIDYFIFLNLVYAPDNVGNNQFVARYKEGEPYFLIPWDLDGTFGYTTTADRSDETRAILSHGLYDRLLALDPAGFKSKLRKRWFALRQNEFSVQNLKNDLSTNFNQLTAEGAYARETMKWPGTVKTGDFPTINSWLQNRISFLDEYFALFPEMASGIDLNYFYGEVVDGGKNLKWATHQKVNAKQFELEFSTDGVNFSHVTTVEATGDAQGQMYNFVHTDNSPLAFYRLKMVSDDDQFTYSSYIQIGSNSCNSAPAAPTISSNQVDITDGQTAILTASGCSQTVVWSTGQTGASIVVKPEVTTVYTAKCRQAAGCESIPSASVKINVYANGSLPGNFEGYMGGIDCTSLRGWVWDKTKPNTALYINLMDGEDVVSTTIVDDFRQDLKDAGKGNGRHGFTFSIPETLKDSKDHFLVAQVLGSSFVLKDSPKKLNCKPATQPVNKPPVVPAVSPLSATVNAAFTATLPVFTDLDSPPLTYALAGLPNGLNFTANNRTISGTPTATATVSLTYSASDGTSTKTVQITLTIHEAPGPPVNQPPVAPAVSPLSATINTAFTATLPAFTDSDSPSLTYSLAGLPDGLSFTDGDRTITGTATATATLSLTYTADDGTNSSHVQIALTVHDLNELPVNQPPVAPTVSPLSATVNTAFTATLPAFTDSDSPSLTYSLTGLPNGLNFTAGDRTISGTATATVALSLTYTASDGTNSSHVQIALTVVSAPPPRTVTGNFDGYLDKVECISFRGWVWDRDKPNQPFAVEFFANGESLGTAQADIFRQDLLAAGKGNGNHVYNFITPDKIKDGKTYEITAFVQNSNYQLKLSPKSLSCPVGSRQSAVSSEAATGSGLRVWPNPGNGTFNVSFDQPADGTSELSVVDELGRTWYRKVVEGPGHQQQQVVLSGANGPYMLVLRQGRQVQSKKILIHK
jgi:hypothetical protein